jgi:4-hydroxy-tetrahydrodipicolinate reductase
MKILLVGYGKMGKTIESIAVSRGHEIVGRVDIGTPDAIKPGADVAIEFTTPESAVGNIQKCLAAGLPVIVGTTGWLSDLNKVKDIVSSHKGTLFHASNFSLGVNIFFKVNEYLARLMNNQIGYNLEIHETHHTAKMDTPSGTAITLADGIIRNLGWKERWVNTASESKDDLVIHSHRIDPAPGIHVVNYHSKVDDIEIRHTAHSREGFALGAVMVAEWIRGRKGVLTMDNFLTF